jgi:hypothetical protein
MPAAVSDNLRAVAVLAACCLVAACSGMSTSSSTTRKTATTHAAAEPKPKPEPKPQPKPTPAPGSLPQTHQLPSGHTPAFRAEMASLWRGIVENSARAALPAFFPEPAYVQLKAVADPGGDYRNRLVAGYRLDIAAAHALVSSSDRLLAVAVPTGYAHWVPPGVCDNRIGYWEVPNARVVYMGGAGTRSFGIASMISWRGVWYVVHLGSVLQPGSVDDPSAGAGASAPSSTC